MECARFSKMDIPKTIVCVDCGQPARLLSYPPEEGWQVGDIVAYRCSGCNDRWDLVVADETEAPTVDPIAAEARAILEQRLRERETS